MNTAQNRLAGLAFAAAGYALLTIGDAVVKSIHGAWPGTAVAMLRYVFGAMGMCTLLWFREGRHGFACPLPLIQLGRGLCVALGSTFFFLAVAVMPLPEATVIQFANPILVAIFSMIFLKETARPAVWVATIIAMAGVVIVIRPNLANVGLAGLLPLGTAISMAMMVIFNRMAAGRASALQAQMLISVMAMPILILITLGGHVSGLPILEVSWPSASVVMKCAIVAVTGSLAHGLIYMATERVSAATMAPVTYIQLVVAVVLSALVFGHWPDLAVYAGSALIIAAGLILWRSAGRAA